MESPASPCGSQTIPSATRVHGNSSRQPSHLRVFSNPGSKGNKDTGLPWASSVPRSQASECADAALRAALGLGRGRWDAQCEEHTPDIVGEESAPGGSRGGSA